MVEAILGLDLVRFVRIEGECDGLIGGGRGLVDEGPRVDASEAMCATLRRETEWSSVKCELKVGGRLERMRKTHERRVIGMLIGSEDRESDGDAT